jgi:hypothetical protein
MSAPNDEVTVYSNVVNCDNTKVATGILGGLSGSKPLDKFVNPIKLASCRYHKIPDQGTIDRIHELGACFMEIWGKKKLMEIVAYSR